MPRQEQVAEETQRILALRQRAAETQRQQEQQLDALVVQIKEARGEMETVVTRLAQLTDQLRQHVRRNPTDSTSRYLVFATAHQRFAGALGAGLRRTASMDRLLDRAKEEQREAREREAERERRQETRDHQRLVDRLTLPTDDDFWEVYGDVVDGEVDDHAE